MKGFLILLFGGFLYSLYGVFSRLIGDSLPIYFLLWTRSLIILAILLVIKSLQKAKFTRFKKADLKWVVVIGLTAGFLGPPFYIAVNKLALGTTLFAFYALGTTASYVLGYFVLNEKLSNIKLISLTIAVIGLALLYSDSLKIGNPVYLFLAGFSGFLFGINITAVKKITKSYLSLQINSVNWLGAFIVAFGASILRSENWGFSFSTPWLGNIGLALISLASSYSVVYGFKFIEVQKGSLVLLSEVVFGIILGIVLYNEIPTGVATIGSLLILVALVIPNIGFLLKANKPQIVQK